LISAESTKIVQTLVAVFFTVISGYLLHRRSLPVREFWPGAEQITYHLLLPALLFTAIISARVDLEKFPRLAFPFIGPVLIMGTLLVLLRGRVARDYPAFTSVFQGSIRFNSYVGFSVALALYGSEGLAMAAMFISLVIPVVNVVTVSVLTGNTRYQGFVNVLRELVRNPLILACIAGLIVKAANFPLPEAVIEYLRILGRASLPLGLMTVGAALEFRRSSEDYLPITVSSLNRLILMPVLMFALCTLFGVTGLARSIGILFAALPGSPAAYVLARQMGGDHRLMANITTVQILLSFVTLPMVLALEVSLPA